MSLIILVCCVSCTDEGDGHFGLTVTKMDIPKTLGLNMSAANGQNPSGNNTTEEPGSTEQPGNNDTTETSFDSSYIGRSNGHELTNKYGDNGVDLNSAEAKAEQQKFYDLEMEEFRDAVSRDSITLHYAVIHPENYGVTPPEEPTYGDLDFSEEFIEKALNTNKKGLSELKKIDRSLLTKTQKLEYDMLVSEYELALESAKYNYLEDVFAYTSGFQSNIPVALSEYRLYTTDDVEVYLGLVRLMKDYVDHLLEYEELRRQNGYFMSAACAEEVIHQCEEFIANPEKNMLIETFNEHITQVEGLTEKQIKDYQEANKKAVQESVIPAYQEVIDYFTEHKNDGKNELGLCYETLGKKYYDFKLRSTADIGLSPDEVIKRLDRAIEDATDQLKEVAYGNYSAYLEYFGEDKLYGDIDPMETIDFNKQAYADRFPEMPDVKYSAQLAHESLREIASPAFYITPALDDIEHNYIYLNLKDDESKDLWYTLAHEGVPGHMYQFCYFLNTKPHPIRAALDYLGYSEGWATYIECMSYSYYTGFKHKEYAAIETLDHQLSLLISARLEIGINYEGWDENKASSWLDEQGFGGNDVKGIMTYVISEPINYQYYVTGWLFFEDLKAYAKEKLGDAFDEKEFHTVILDAGATPLWLLQDWVDTWITEKLG